MRLRFRGYSRVSLFFSPFALALGLFQTLPPWFPFASDRVVTCMVRILASLVLFRAPPSRGSCFPAHAGEGGTPT